MYFETHRGRTLTPVFAFGDRGVIGNNRLQRVSSSVRAIELGEDIEALGPDRDTLAAREATVRGQADACFAFIRQPGDDELLEILFDELVYQVCKPG